MKNSKKLFLIVLSVLIVAFVSCKSNEDPESGSAPFTVSSIVGTWTSTVDANNTFTVADNGNVTFNAGSSSATLTITSWDTDKDQSVTQYSITLSGNLGSQSVEFTFTFKSANSCDLTMTGATGSEPFTKQ